MTEEEKLSAFRVMLRNAASAVFLGGAGVSTESGIPDFRSKDGLYHKTEKRFAN
jgi:NAD-dependent deacetylase